MELARRYWDVRPIFGRPKDARSTTANCLRLLERYECQYRRNHRSRRGAGTCKDLAGSIYYLLTLLQLAQKAIRDRLTRILVIAGACAGICYNALWYFPILLVVGGIITVLWDLWLAQKVGKAKAKWEAKRRRARNEAGDAEVNATQDIQAVELQVQRPEAVKRRVHAGSSTDRIVTEEGASEPGRTGSQRSTEFNAPVIAPSVAEVGTHTISVKLSISLIVGFLGE